MRSVIHIVAPLALAALTLGSSQIAWGQEHARARTEHAEHARVTHVTQARGRVYVHARPPAARYEAPRARPSPRHVWIPGRWTWNHDRYAWMGGMWALPPRIGAYWVPGHWVENPDGTFYWTDGFWAYR